jgi:alkanesulfonate monooxygenase SsuD/methylene tetrahydromethanopterin reductase-like flavin-dependent oxidoreductase (luciferase family)
MFMCARTDEEARAKADGATFFQFCLRYYNSADRKRPGPGQVDMWTEYTKWKAANAQAAEQALSGGLIGSPETLQRKLRKFEQSHIDQVILLNQAGRNAHQDICDSLELFANEVMPEFHANIPAHEEWKADVLSGTRALEEIDTEQFTQRYGAKAVKL